MCLSQDHNECVSMVLKPVGKKYKVYDNCISQIHLDSCMMAYYIVLYCNFSIPLFFSFMAVHYMSAVKCVI